MLRAAATLLCLTLSVSANEPGLGAVTNAIAESWSPREVLVEWTTNSSSLANWEQLSDWRLATALSPNTRGAQAITLTRDKSGDQTELVKISGYARILTNALTSSRVIPANRSVIASDLTVELIDVTQVRDDLLTSGDVYPEMVSARALIPMRPLTASDFVPANSVEEGQMVTAQYVEGSIRIAVRGRALSSGREGQRIRIKEDHTRRIHDVLVGKEGQLEIVRR